MSELLHNLAEPLYFNSRGESLLSCVFRVNSTRFIQESRCAAFKASSGSNHNQGSEHAQTFATCIVSIDPVYLICSCTLRTARENFVYTE